MSPHRSPPTASSAATSVPANNAPSRDAVLDESADNNTADDHTAAGGDDLVTGDGAHVDLADSDDDATDKEDNASAITVQATPGARFWRAPGTTTRIHPGAVHRAATRIRPSAAPGYTASIRLGVAPGTG